MHSSIKEWLVDNAYKTDTNYQLALPFKIIMKVSPDKKPQAILGLNGIIEEARKAVAHAKEQFKPKESFQILQAVLLPRDFIEKLNFSVNYNTADKLEDLAAECIQHLQAFKENINVISQLNVKRNNYQFGRILGKGIKDNQMLIKTMLDFFL